MRTVSDATAFCLIRLNCLPTFWISRAIRMKHCKRFWKRNARKPRQMKGKWDLYYQQQKSNRTLLSDHDVDERLKRRKMRRFSRMNRVNQANSWPCLLPHQHVSEQKELAVVHHIYTDDLRHHQMLRVVNCVIIRSKVSTGWFLCMRMASMVSLLMKW